VISIWLRHGEPLMGSAPYHEIAPHLVLMAFLDRVVNGGDSLEREYAISRDRMDLCLRYHKLIVGIEIKVWRDQKPDPLTQGLAQLERYLARLDQAFGWLVIFDRRSQEPDIATRLNWSLIETEQGRQVTLIRA
jgi:hypothetical protein